MIFFDTETTGLLSASLAATAHQPELIEFAAIKLDVKLKEIGRLEFFCRPANPITEEIQKITRITPEMVEDAKPFRAFYGELCNFFLGERAIVGHNVTFDIGVLRYELERIGKVTAFPWPPQQICTIEASMPIQSKRLNLGALHTMATGKPHEDAHRAMPDVEALVTCYKWLKKEGWIQ